jgi:Mn-containing catalase
MTDRKQVKENLPLMGECETWNISEFIKKLQELQTKGYEKIEIVKGEDYEGEYHYLAVSKTRPETDSEYNNRIAQENKMKETRRNAYEILKKEFGE